MRVTSTAHAGATAGINVLVYGPPDAGKTTLCQTAPAPLILSAESGLLSLRKVDIPVIQIATYAELLEAYNWCAGAAEARAFQTVCLDSISEIAEVVLAHELSVAKDPRQAYGELITKVMLLCRNFRDMQQFNTYFSAKQEREKDEGTGMMLYGPSMPGKKLGPALAYLFDLVFQARVITNEQGERIYSLLTKSNSQYVAKDRSGVLPELVQPDLGAIFNAVRGH